MDTGLERGVFDSHQFQHSLREGQDRGLGPVTIPLQQAGDGEGGGLSTWSRKAGNSVSEADNDIGDIRVGLGHRKEMLEGARGITPSLRRKGINNGSAITSAVEGVISLFHEEGKCTGLACGCTEVKELGDV